MKTTADPLRQYFIEIARHPLLTSDEELTLGKAVMEAQQILEAGGPSSSAERRIVRAGERAKRRFVNGNLRLVVTVAKSFTSNVVTMDMLDLIQEGNFGLIKAVERYDYTRGYKFSTYAYWWIRQAMRRAIQQKERQIRLPSQLAEIANKWNRVIGQQTQLLGRTPTPAELGEALKISEAEVLLLMERNRGRTYSLDALLNTDDATSTLGEVFYSRAVDAEHREETEVREDIEGMLTALMLLSDKEQAILRARYGIGQSAKSFQQIADSQQLCRERVRQLASRSLNRLKYLIETSQVRTA